MAYNLPDRGIYNIDPNAAPSPFQSLFSQNVVRTPDGRYFLPLSKSNIGQSQAITPGGTEAGGTYRDNGDDTRTWIPDDNRPYYAVGDDKYYSLQDYYNALDPNSAGVGIIGSGRQNAISFAGAQRGNYKGESGYYVDPNTASGSHPATTTGQKGTESGLSQFLVQAGLMYLGGGGLTGTVDSVAGNATSLAGEGLGASTGEAVGTGVGEGVGEGVGASGGAAAGNAVGSGGGEAAGSGLTAATTADPALSTLSTATPTTDPAPVGTPDPALVDVPPGTPPETLPPDPPPGPQQLSGPVDTPAALGSAGETFPSGGGGPGLSSAGGPEDFGPPVATPSASNTEFDAAIRSGTEGAGGGLGDVIDQATLDKALKYGPAVLGAYNAYSSRQNAKQYSSEMKDIGAPQRDIGNQLVAQYKTGEVNAADKFAIDQWEQGALARARAYYAKAGISDSSMAQSAENEIHAKAAAMKQEALNNVLQTGLNALNIVDKYQAEAIRAEMAGDQATVRQVQDFLNSYGNWLRMLPVLTGSGSGTAPAK